MEQDRAKLTTRLLDHEMGYAPRSWIRLDEQEAFNRISAALDGVTEIIKNVNKIFAPDVREKAFGPMGQPGNVTRISHLASRVVGLVDEGLTWSATLRGLSVPGKYEEVYEAAARFVDQPISDVFEFIDDFVKLAIELPELVRQSTPENPVSIDRVLRISVDQRTLDRFLAAIERLREDDGP